MASNHRQLYSFVGFIALLLIPAVSLAKEIIVGDDAGWASNFDYQKWAVGKDFAVGDKLVFQYTAGAHNVLKVNGSNFQACNKEPLDGNVLRTGNDVITLATPGRKWYICGVAQHCAAGLKLAINVTDRLAQPPAPTGATPGADAPSSANGNVPSGHLLLMAAIIAVATTMMIM